jgi:hypothetical protein
MSRENEVLTWTLPILVVVPSNVLVDACGIASEDDRDVEQEDERNQTREQRHQRRTQFVLEAE